MTLSSSPQKGMRSKLLATKLANEQGIETTIGNGRVENIIQRILAKETIGTTISTE